MWCLAVALPTVQVDLGVSRADISFAYTMNMLGFFAGGVLAGRLVDRRGIVVTSILSAIGLSAGFALAPLAPSLMLFAAAQVLIGFSAAATFAPLVADVSHWFEKRRGVAVAIAASGNYIAGALWPPIVEPMIREFGWRTTYLTAAAFCLVDDDPAGADAAAPAAGPRGNARSPPSRAARRPRSACRPTPCRRCWPWPASPAASPCRCRRSISSPTAPISATAWRAARRCCR